MNILKYQNLEYTQDQKNMLEYIETELIKFNSKESKEKEIRISGFAGTGKTTVIYNIIEYAREYCKNRFSNVSILAPTNKAKLVLMNKMPLKADYFSTIHSFIYGSPDDDFAENWSVKSEVSNALIVIDESSMIDETRYNDIKECIVNSFIIFIGDGYQLEPVGKDAKLLKSPDVLLTEVKRNAGDILNYSIQLRENNKIMPVKDFNDIKSIKYGEILDFYVDLLRKNVDSVYITATNAYRVQSNLKIKRRLSNNEELEVNDKVLSISNSLNYCNGEVYNADTVKIIKTVNIKFKTQYKEYEDIVTVCYINGKFTLFLPTTQESSVYHYAFNKLDYDTLLSLVGEDNIEWDNSGRFPQLSKKVVIATYGYAISCHKSQGSQWDTVIVDQNWLSNSSYGWNNTRWLYTAITRAEKNLIIVER